jgi:hypothetical protein
VLDDLFDLRAVEGLVFEQRFGDCFECVAIGNERALGQLIGVVDQSAHSPELESRLQELRVAGIVKRAGGSDNRFTDSASTRRFLADLEKNERDQPLALAEDLALLRSSGLRHVCVFWLEYRELVSGGQK